ncbi:MAG: LacI family DNA-binding transcriptional regulator [Betaproteobacteria bacterium]|nr:LacI family DNA-binding transcriptional regulator [Betaproteobacteria bacterium]NBZ98322.1 LacI family DNA-binding transcriptional regulator [Betaproteobacteria bacterium]NDD02348.1 LacI family DNA-binding transcriptional regulator [Betaproteobacteria bacterium]NDD22886.1 LacI family DNA-binding transcriptional regulator [Betaproteobacteria bacterium]NDE24630.1 LacI family DNA-binding transcriptional regulator [Betaproteobacteria bacterium]
MKTFNSRPKHHRSTGRITLNDVAQAAGVSPSTVSRALRGERAVDPDLVQRVLAVSEKLGYVPDPAARALASQRSDHVTILIPMLTNALFVDLLEAAQRSLRAAGFQTLMGVTHYNTSEEEQLLREQLHHRPAGMLITGLDHSPSTQKLMARSKVPCVHLMDLPEELGPISSGDAERDAMPNGPYCVGFRQIDAGEAMTNHLLAKGKKRIVFAAAQLDPRVMQRLQGWRKALKARQMYDPTLEWLNPAPSSLALGGLMLEQIMKQNAAVDAIFFCNDDLAQGALLAAMRLGISVPQQVAIAGFNDLTGSDQMWPPLTTVRTPRAQVGEAAAQMLLQLIHGETPEHPQLDLGFEIVVRQST